MKKSQPLFKNIVPINNTVHLNYKISEVINFNFSKNTNAAILTTAEFEKGSKTYPILFISEGEDILPVALLGLEDKQNLFLKWNNQWDASYIPAHIRRYPFSLATVDSSSEFIVCIDEKATVIGKSGEHSLFLNNGKQSDYLNEKIRFLQELQVESEKTLKFTKRVNELDLFEPMNANINLNNGDNISISGFYTINKEKFKALDGQVFKDLVESDDMKLIYEHLTSLDNFSKLINVIAERKVVSKKRTNGKKNPSKGSETI
ncbi:MAG: SapC family protein [Gammaproteobacteria bacterium]|nr:SapC family protein [Gammaproteobacteria bacterium]